MKFTFFINGEIRKYDTETYDDKTRKPLEHFLKIIDFYEEEAIENQITIISLEEENGVLRLLRMNKEQLN